MKYLTIYRIQNLEFNNNNRKKNETRFVLFCELKYNIKKKKEKKNEIYIIWNPGMLKIRSKIEIYNSYELVMKCIPRRD